MHCQYTIDGTTYSLPEFKAWLVNGGLDVLYPDGKYPFVVPGAKGMKPANLPEKITIDGVERWTVNSNGKPIAQDEQGIRNFYKWFSDSKVVDEQGRPLVVYHGTSDVFTVFDRTNDIGYHFGTLYAAQDRSLKTGKADVSIERIEPSKIDSDSLAASKGEIKGSPAKELYSTMLHKLDNPKQNLWDVILQMDTDEINGVLDEYRNKPDSKRFIDRVERAQSGIIHKVYVNGVERSSHKTSREANAVYEKLKRESTRPMAAYLALQNPIRLSDLGVWPAQGIANASGFSKSEMNEVYDSGDADAQYETVKRILESKGYDGIVYTNEVEHTGSDSFIAFNPTQIKDTGNTGQFDPNNPDIRFASSSIASPNKPTKGITQQQAQTAIDQFASDFGGAKGVTFRSFANEQEAFGDGFSVEKHGPIKGFFRVSTNEVGIIRSRMENNADITRTLRHETLAHFGLNALPAGDRHAFLAAIARSRSIPGVRDLFNRVEDLYPDLANDEFEQAEEVFALVAEDTPSALREWFDSIVATLAKLLRKAGLLRGVVTRSELNQYVKSIADGIRRGDTKGVLSGSDVVKFSKELNSTETAQSESDIYLSRSPMKSVTANIDRGLKALSNSIFNKSSVHRAMFRQGLGWVDFVWGSEGRIKSSGKTKGAFGISHILEARMRKDGLTEKEALNLLGELVRTIASGEEFDRKEIGNSIRVGLRHDGYIAWLSKLSGSNAWVVSGYEEHTDGRAAGRATYAPTQSATSLTRSGLGAVTDNNTLEIENNPDIRYSRASLIPSGSQAVNSLRQKIQKLTSPESITKLIYEFQDKYVDLKNLRKHIQSIGGTISDLNDAYQGETLYHGRVGKRTEDFLSDEIKPLLAGLRSANVKIEDFERYLHARHAPEANAAMAKRNPNQQMIDEGRHESKAEVARLTNELIQARKIGSATKAIEDSLQVAKDEAATWSRAQAFKGTEAERLSLSGMSDAEAQAIMDELPEARRKTMGELAAMVDAINAKTLNMLQEYGLMSREDLDAWRAAYQYYIPLHRDEAHPDSISHPIGQGFSVRGDAARQRVGSNEKVTHIMGHIAMQREAAITRGEKNRVAQSLYLMARQNPLPEYWSTEIPKKSYIDNETGFVKTGIDPLYKQRPDVVMARVSGKDVAVVFNEHNPQMLRLAHSMKNLDVDDLHYLIPFIGKGTRWLASVNTQYNPIFGIINLARDVQTGALNLTTTALNGKQGDVLKNTKAILREVLKNKGRMPKSGEWANLLDEFESVGGATGYRDLYLNPEDRSKALLKELESLNRGDASKAAHAITDWLSDYNNAMENSVRLAAYKVALDSGMSKQKAAVLAKNLTVNFNKKGRQTRELGALYAFFNAALQGTVRMHETLKGPQGKKIMAGGVALGAMNALLGIAMMGGGDDGDDDEWAKIPEFIKERSIIIPISHEDYIAIPMPLGFNFIPNIGRIAVETAAYGGQNMSKRMGNLAGVIADAFNPVGASSSVSQMLAPTVLDPIVALMENKDWTGKPIYREDYSNLDPTPGFARTKTTASPWSKAFAEAINTVTGGTEYSPGAWSPTPDQIDFVIGQVTGGIGRELAKTAEVAAAPFNDEELPAYKIPLVGRLYGNTRGASGNADQYYENLRDSNMIENEIKGRVSKGESIDDYLADNPNAMQIVIDGDMAEKRINLLKKQRELYRSNGASSEQIKAISQGISDTMKDFNRKMLKN